MNICNINYCITFLGVAYNLLNNSISNLVKFHILSKLDKILYFQLFTYNQYF